MQKVLVLFIFIGAMGYGSDFEVNYDDCFKISIEKKLFNSKYLVEGEVLSSSDLKESVLLYPESKNLYSRSKTMFYISLPFVVTSGFFFGYELGNVVMGEELNYTNISIGAGLQVINLLFQYLSNRDLDLAVESYNSKL